MAGAVGLGIQQPVISAEADILGAGDGGAVIDLDLGVVLQIGRGIGVWNGDDAADIAERRRHAGEAVEAQARTIAASHDIDIGKPDQGRVRTHLDVIVGDYSDIGIGEADARQAVGIHIGVRADRGGRVRADIDRAERAQGVVAAERDLVVDMGAVMRGDACSLQQAARSQGGGVVGRQLGPGLEEHRPRCGRRAHARGDPDIVPEDDLRGPGDVGDRSRASPVDAATGGSLHGVAEVQLREGVAAGDRNRLLAARQIAAGRVRAGRSDAAASTQGGEDVDGRVMAPERGAGAHGRSLQAVDQRRIAVVMARRDRDAAGIDYGVFADRGRYGGGVPGLPHRARAGIEAAAARLGMDYLRVAAGRGEREAAGAARRHAGAIAERGKGGGAAVSLGIDRADGCGAGCGDAGRGRRLDRGVACSDRDGPCRQADIVADRRRHRGRVVGLRIGAGRGDVIGAGTGDRRGSRRSAAPAEVAGRIRQFRGIAGRRAEDRARRQDGKRAGCELARRQAGIVLDGGTHRRGCTGIGDRDANGETAGHRGALGKGLGVRRGRGRNGNGACPDICTGAGANRGGDIRSVIGVRIGACAGREQAAHTGNGSGMGRAPAGRVDRQSRAGEARACEIIRGNRAFGRALRQRDAEREPAGNRRAERVRTPGLTIEGGDGGRTDRGQRTAERRAHLIGQRALGNGGSGCGGKRTRSGRRLDARGRTRAVGRGRRHADRAGVGGRRGEARDDVVADIGIGRRRAASGRAAGTDAAGDVAGRRTRQRGDRDRAAGDAAAGDGCRRPRAVGIEQRRGALRGGRDDAAAIGVEEAVLLPRIGTHLGIARGMPEAGAGVRTIGGETGAAQRQHAVAHGAVGQKAGIGVVGGAADLIGAGIRRGRGDRRTIGADAGIAHQIGDRTAAQSRVALRRPVPNLLIGRAGDAERRRRGTAQGCDA